MLSAWNDSLMLVCTGLFSLVALPVCVFNRLGKSFLCQFFERGFGRVHIAFHAFRRRTTGPSLRSDTAKRMTRRMGTFVGIGR